MSDTGRRRPTPAAGVSVLLLATGVSWVVGLSRNGWANAFYSAAVQAGTRSGKAALFGSSDAANSITVDKPPASLWPMELSARLFGLNTWSMLIPQVLIGVASVALLYAAVSRTFGSRAGLLAGSLLALTPVATLMFRYNNPDALLVLLMVAAAWAVLRAVDDGRTRWLALCGTLVGFAFLTKQLQVMLIVPAIVACYLAAGPPRLAARIAQLAVAAVSMVVAAGWWVALVSIVPAADRPYIGGSTDNSFLNLTFGYNGIARLTGHRPPGQPAPHHEWTRSHAGPLRMFTGESAGQISWLLPAALILMVAGLIWCGRGPRTDRRRAQYILWGTWLIVGGGVLSAMSGTYHDYYTVALAPPVAALVALGWADARRRSDQLSVRLVLGITVAVTAAWSFVLLSRTTEFVPALRWIVAAVGLLAASLIVAGPPRLAGSWRWLLAATVCVATLGGPAAYCVQTLMTAHQGGIVNAGPPLPGGEHGGSHRSWSGMKPSEVTATMIGMLDENAAAFTWVAATQGANQAAAYQLATGHPVMPIGGFVGRDPSPTLEQFQRDVADGRIHYFIESPNPDDEEEGPGNFKDSASAEVKQITAWVTSTFPSRIVGGASWYDLTAERKA